jgi:hypothetical protein
METAQAHRAATVKKSHANMLDAWVLSNRRQVVWFRRVGADGTPEPLEDPTDRGRTDPMAYSEQLTPDTHIPQPGLSLAIRSISATTTGSTGGRPGRFGYVQCRRPADDATPAPWPGSPTDAAATPAATAGSAWPARTDPPVQPRSRAAPAQNLVLVPQHEQLQLQARAASGQQGKPLHDPAEDHVQKAPCPWSGCGPVLRPPRRPLASRSARPSPMPSAGTGHHRQLPAQARNGDVQVRAWHGDSLCSFAAPTAAADRLLPASRCRRPG